MTEGCTERECGDIFEAAKKLKKMESSSSSAKDTCVQVALRIRPQGTREKLEGSRVCTSVLPGEPQVTIGGDRSFTYDYIFDQPTPQHAVFEGCVERLVEGLFDGYNATVLAYGQTGSGKTHTMGTAFDATAHLNPHDAGVIPRAIQHVFRKISESKSSSLSQGLLEPIFEVSVQFVELYNDDILDLLTEDRATSALIRIHEDNRGEIVLNGVAVRPVQDLETTMEILKNGALNRTVASTNMNEQSSRSHAIFTLHLKQQRVVSSLDENGQPTPPKPGDMEMEMLSAKFHFVDLAGSERMKRTGATGERAREGISINVGLLALGNVIAALGGATGKVSHVPYRDSKLTRLLQDSLGGNSRTLMIACVSPSDSDFVETLNTMKYANRAKEIKNKVVANQDKSSKMIGELRGRIASLESELLEFKQGRRTLDSDGTEVVNDQYHENVLLTAEVNQLRFRVKALTETNEILRSRNVDLMAAKDSAALQSSDSVNGNTGEDGEVDTVQKTFRKYLEELERTKSSLYESQATCDQLRKEMSRWKAQATGRIPQDSVFSPNITTNKLIDMARSEIDRERKNFATADAGQTSDYASLGAGAATEEDGTSNDADELDEDDLDRDEDMDEDEAEEMKKDAECNAMQDNLNDVMSEISIKERLIEQLEISEHRLQSLRVTYERKLSELSLRIKATEAERDKILAEGAARQTGKMSDDQAKRIREEYERKIADMRKEYKKLQALEREHQKLQEKGERERQQMRQYESELKDLKKMKVDLVKKINEEKKRQQQQAQANAKALAARDKQSRMQANKIRTLEMKDKQREQFLKKTTVEVSQLRKERAQQQAAARAQLNKTSTAAAMRTPRVPVNRRNLRAGQPEKELSFSPKQAKMKWSAIEKMLERSVVKRQLVRKMEDELERYLQERHKLISDIAVLEKTFVSSSEIIDRDGLMEALDSAKQKMIYLQEQITESQKAIVDVDEQV
ncbi:unnamed protein product [Caenorhabditis auriculariae]|uniref:Kinesin-like protein n=1 Tax=Caenorhabditis auriculariae TaxID=2777116 RepID=A0A8S1HVU2_9PELO|nr:unnamed protein product [Caenorhabditis auriculariae]